MSTFIKNSQKKLVILGLAESGKSTMINGVIEGLKPRLGDKYDATINYQRKAKSFYGTEIIILDLGGQTRFLDRFTGELAEFVFSDVETGAFIFVIEPLQVTEFSRAKYYFELTLQKLDQYSPNSLVYVFLNKMDLLPPELSKKTSETIKEYLFSDLSRELRFYETSVFSESIFKAIGDVLAEITGIREIISPILIEFIQNESTIIDQVQVLTKEGAILLTVKNESNLLNLPLRASKEIFDLSVQQIKSSDEVIDRIVAIEYKKKLLSLAHFMDNELVIMAILSKKGIKENIDLAATIYDQILALSTEINNLIT
ncbi:MAG: ADP-ribosylation factor-like protein [Candidatus Hodarchaeales archaeon]|jgi:GTPase SAR1 family protein